MRIFLNADDLGMSKGVNSAIKDAHLKGFLTHASLMANMEFFSDAVENVIKRAPQLKVGVHVNLTCGISNQQKSTLSKMGIFQNSFLSLLLLIKTKKVLHDLEIEIEAQIIKIKKSGIDISHIDGHEHIHIIPSINKIVCRLASKYDIPRIRAINENFSLAEISKSNFSNLLKLIILKFLSLFNKRLGHQKFYSILQTCQVNADLLFDFLNKNKTIEEIELMLHPSKPELDLNIDNLDRRFISFLHSDYRRQEFQVCFDERFRDYFNKPNQNK